MTPGALASVTLTGTPGGHTSLIGVPSVSMEVPLLPQSAHARLASRTVIVQVDTVRSL